MKTKILLLSLATFVLALNLFADNYYVKTTGVSTNTGASWEEPITLDAALSIAQAATNDVIHIAAGVYVPDVQIVTVATDLTDRDKTFEISKNVTLIGGYPADATTGAVANSQDNITILSGDLGGGVKAYHTMVITAPPVAGQKVSINGISIKNGKADVTSNVTTTNNNFSMSRGLAGGVCVIKSTVEFVDCNIAENIANMGAALTTLSYANVTLNRCNVVDNTTNGNGTLYVNSPYSSDNGTDYAYLTVYNSNISGNNLPTGTGAGLYTYQYCKVYVHGSTISNNTASAGNSGAYLREGCLGYIINSTVHGNTASGRGGLFVYSTTSKKCTFDVINTTITANTGVNTGGLEISNYSTTSIYNSIISGNADAAKEYRPIAGSTTALKNVVASDKAYDNDGAEISGVSFDKATIGTLSDNGGYTKTCLISGVDNPAKVYGMTAVQLTALASSYTPAIASDVITKDQIGNSRSESTTMGAVLKTNSISTVNSVVSSTRKIWSQDGALFVETLSGEEVAVYSVSGKKLHSQLAVDGLTMLSPFSKGIYIVKVGNDVLKAVAR
jgi:hypothetical protein